MNSMILLIIVFIIIDIAYTYVLIKQTNYIEAMKINLEISETEIEKEIEFAGKLQEENEFLRSENNKLKRIIKWWQQTILGQKEEI